MRIREKCSSPDNGVMLFWTEEQLIEFLRKAGEEAEERERRKMRLKKTVETDAAH